MTTEFCLCGHAAKDHTKQAGKCSQCDCREFDLDPFLEAGPDGKPVVTFLEPIEDLLEPTDEEMEREHERERW